LAEEVAGEPETEADHPPVGTGNLYLTGHHGYPPQPIIPNPEEADMETDDRDDLPCFRGHFQAA
jgi:hypothetical protein